MKEFDAEYYVKSLRNLQMLVSSLMDDSERFMNVYQHSNAISISKNDTDMDTDDDTSKAIPKMIKDKNSKEHEETVQNFIDDYIKETLSAKDYKLLKGAFTKNKLKNSELHYLYLDKEDSFDKAHEESLDFHNLEAKRGYKIFPDLQLHTNIEKLNKRQDNSILEESKIEEGKIDESISIVR